MPIVIASRRKNDATLKKLYPDAALIDVTSKGIDPWVKFSPFYPHGNIPVPFSPDVTAQSVEGIWQGLKVFESADIDTSKFNITTMKNLKRTVRTHGAVKGHRKGIHSDSLLTYREARYQIYLPCYKWGLDNCLQDEIAKLRDLAQSQTVVLLDYETNTDINDLSKPLSHAALIKRFVDNLMTSTGLMPDYDDLQDFICAPIVTQWRRVLFSFYFLPDVQPITPKILYALWGRDVFRTLYCKKGCCYCRSIGRILQIICRKTANVVPIIAVKNHCCRCK